MHALLLFRFLVEFVNVMEKVLSVVVTLLTGNAGHGGSRDAGC